MQSPIRRISLFLLLALFFQNIILAQPANNVCGTATAILIKTDSACVTGKSSLTGQTLTLATPDGGAITSTCTAVNAPDVWYKFAAKTQYPTITLSGLGTGWTNTLKVQLLSGTCGSFTEVACGNNNPATATFAITPANTTPLTPGDTFYVRIYRSNITSPAPVSLGFTICITDAITKGSRMGEVFSRTILSPALALQYPWEVTYGPDDSLWVTEARGYKVYKMSPNTGVKRTILDLSFGSTWFGATGTGGADTLYAQQSVASWNSNYGNWPQGGFAGMALHPRLLDGSGHDFVYVTYIWKYLSGTNPDGVFYRNKLVRFTYNTTTGRLENPAVLDWNLPGSKDHNSQRLTIAPVIKGGTNYLFMSSGDMGAGQFENRYRTMNAQNPASYEGKILRFNLESDNPTTGETGNAQWIPNDNPYFSGTSAVWNIGIRNNQGFAYDTASNILYGSSHGPYSDDEINIIEGFKNYGHPLVIGYAADGNYNGNAASGTNTSVSAGSPFSDCNIAGYTPPVSFTSPYCGKSTIAPVGNEVTNRTAINAGTNGQYKDPIFSAYPSSAATILNTWQTNPGNAGWESEGWSGLDLYSNKIIPGWKKSLVAAGLKWGRIIKLNLDVTGTATLPSNIGGSVGNAGDTITYFQSTNRYRDLAFAPNGKDIFLVMDNSATSGPSGVNPTAPACPGCVVKYTFLGYDSAAAAPGVSKIPKSIEVTDGTANTCNAGTTITIDGTNNFLWVPITGPDGNMMAEINAMGQSLGAVTSSFYKNSGAVRANGGISYLDRNITITPTVTTFSIPVKVRLYISKTELNALIAAPASGVASISNLKILKNNDACGAAVASVTTLLAPTNTIAADLLHGTNGYVLQTNVSGFSSFYFGSTNITTLPLDLLTFTGVLENNAVTLLKWTTTNQINTSHFVVERSITGNNFNTIGVVNAVGNNSNVFNYSFNDNNAANQRSPILFYRLKITDANGAFKYSNVISVSLPGINGTITISPNPAVNNLNAAVTSPVTGTASWRVIDNTGRTILYSTTLLKKGSNVLSININKLAVGSYYLYVSGDGINVKTKFQKL
jgi:trimeric autotransporter adhesin